MQKEFNIKKFLLLLFFLTSIFANEAKYSSFVMQQIAYIDKLNDKDITQDEIKNILLKQKAHYSSSLERIMSNKKSYIDNNMLYESKIFALEKIIKINTRVGNDYAVIRDEVQVKSYKILKNQHEMMSNILLSLDNEDNVLFSKKLNALIEKNKEDTELLLKVNYKETLEIEAYSKALIQAKENIKEFYAIVDINADVIKFLHISEHKMYRLNKYSKYNLISTVLFINKSRLAETINPILETYGLNVVKLLLMIILITAVYIARIIFFFILNRNVKNLDNSAKYSKAILIVAHKPLDRLIFVININILVYIYNDFNTLEVAMKFFNMVYAGIFTFMLFRVINVASKIKVNSLEASNTKVKNDVINVGIKLLNFLILILGILIILHFAGANLTAVLSGLGIGGFAVALAAKDSLANFFGTLSILFSDVFSQGDWIVVNGEEGVVIEIGTRVTTLRTFDNALIAIPNAILANQDVKNWNKRSLGRRIKMSLGIKYGASSQDIKNAVNEIRHMLDVHEDIATENTAFNYRERQSTKLVSKDDAQGIKKTLLVYLDEFTDSSMNILVYCFTKSTDWQEWLETKEEVMHRIMDIFERNNIEFAFPSLSLYHENEK